jgi:hypothetical protein
MPENIEQKLDSLQTTPADAPPLPEAILARSRTIRQQSCATTIALYAAPVVIVTIAAITWISLTNSPIDAPPTIEQQLTNTSPDRPTIALEDATPTNLLRINKNFDLYNLILPQVYTHTTTTPVPTVGSSLRTERSIPPSP